MILWPRRKTRRRYADTIVVRADERAGGRRNRTRQAALQAKVVWGESDIKSIVTRLPRMRPETVRRPGL